MQSKYIYDRALLLILKAFLKYWGESWAGVNQHSSVEVSEAMPIHPNWGAGHLQIDINFISLSFYKQNVSVGRITPVL